MSVSIQAVNVLNFAGMGGLKSTQDRQERQQKCESQVNFFEKQKEKLKDMKCSSLEEIARKLEMFHTYEDQIAAAKQQFNNSQMSHVLDEAKEIGEKIAEEAEKTAPKTPEERKDDMIEEATGKDEESKGMLSEIMDEMAETVEELEEQLEEELQEELEQEVEEGLPGMEEAVEDLAQQPQELVEAEDFTQRVQELVEEKQAGQEMLSAAQEVARQVRIFQTEPVEKYQHIDYRL